MDPEYSGYFAMVTVTIICLVSYAFFVMLGVAVLRSSRSRLREMDLNKDFGAHRARKILKASDKFLLIVQTGNLLSGLGLGISVFRISEMSREYFWESVLGGVPGSSYEHFAFIFILVLTTVLALTLAQVAKAIAYSRPENVLSLLAYPLALIGIAFTPVIYLLEDFIGSVIGFCGYRKPAEREIVLSSEDLTELVEHSTRAGEIEEAERELIQGVVSFGDKMVSEIMTPRTDVVSVQASDSVDSVTRVFEEAGFSRLLVIGEELDDVKGVVLAKDLLPYVGKEVDIASIESLLRKPLFVEGALAVGKLLHMLRRKAAHLAVVLDEHGGVDGLVTMEDLIEEIVGEIFDEHDSPDDEREVERTVNGEWLVDGGTDLNDLRYEHGIHFPDGEYDTIAGFVIHNLGHIPEEGEHFLWDGYTVSVQEVDQNRITLLKISSGDVL